MSRRELNRYALKLAKDLLYYKSVKFEWDYPYLQFEFSGEDPLPQITYRFHFRLLDYLPKHLQYIKKQIPGIVPGSDPINLNLQKERKQSKNE